MGDASMQDTSLDASVEEDEDEDVEEEETPQEEVPLEPSSEQINFTSSMMEDDDLTSIDSHSKKIKKMKRFLSQNMKKRFQDVHSISQKNENRVNIVDLKKQAKLLQKEDDKIDEEIMNSSDLTSKQKRKLVRDKKNKKVGNHYYSTANVKNRNRDKKIDTKKKKKLN